MLSVVQDINSRRLWRLWDQIFLLDLLELELDDKIGFLRLQSCRQKGLKPPTFAAHSHQDKGILWASSANPSLAAILATFPRSLGGLSS